MAISIFDSAKHQATKAALDEVEKDADKELIFDVDQQHVEAGIEVERGRFSITGYVMKQFQGAKEFVIGGRGRIKFGKK